MNSTKMIHSTFLLYLGFIEAWGIALFCLDRPFLGIICGLTGFVYMMLLMYSLSKNPIKEDNDE